LFDEGTFDVIVCSSDTLAQGAMMEAESRGLRIPHDLAVIGFGAEMQKDGTLKALSEKWFGADVTQ
ncbi:substrate-binding domain-containing protein, partial [Salmonella enterica subsp. enterica serovar Kentucky]|nr:substrate-binding domain-containing protein [Salmonella enterica subsp. enterica serovar Kentucky]